MTAYYQDNRIAAGHDVALISLVNIESITPPGDVPFFAPKALPMYRSGQKKYRLNGQLSTAGFAYVKWHFTRLTYKQYSYLRTTYCAGGLSGDVTIYTPLKGAASYSRMNATLVLPDPEELKSQFRYQEVDILFGRLATAA